MKVGSLFSGIGGIELGFEREGFETAWFVEKDKFCQAVLRKHWPNVEIFEDVSEVDFARLPKVDVLTGGFPCQDISIAGKGKGIVDGERSSLWKYFAKAIGEIRPKYAVIENVSALTFRGLSNVLADLAKEGYDAEWFDLRASDFGALHKRERIFIVAYLNQNRKPISPINEGEKSEGLCVATNPSECGCNNGGNSWRARQVLQNEEWEMEKGEQARHKRKHGLDKEFGFEFADSKCERCGRWRDKELAQTENDAKVSGRSSPLILANDWSDRIQRFKQETFSRSEGFSWCQNVRRIEDFKDRPDIPQPLFRGARDGIPTWTYRIKSLGNAVVPQCAQFIAKRIKEIENSI